MNFIFLRNLLGSTFAISPEWAAAYMPTLRGALSGLEVEAGEEPIENRPYLVSAATMIASSSAAPDDGRMVAITTLRGVMMKHDAVNVVTAKNSPLKFFPNFPSVNLI